MEGIRWKSSWSFIFATAAAAIGLGNIWRFTYVVGENGGGAFVMVYILCIALLGLPLIISEIVLGKMHRSHPIAVMRSVALSSTRSGAWGGLGGLMLLAGFLILTYYVVITGWVLHYFFHSLVQGFSHQALSTAEDQFQLLQSSPGTMLISTVAVVVLACVILAFGVKKGLERAILVIFPVMLLVIFLLLGYAILDGHFSQGVRYLFYPDFSKVSSGMFLSALGQAFFSLGVGMGVTCMFSAYLPEGVSVVRAALWVVVADTAFALLSGLIIFPFVISFGLKFSAGPGLIFSTLPLVFSKMVGGYWVGWLFFLLVFFAAFSSVIALLEPTLCWVCDRFSMKRGRAVTLLGCLILLISLGTIASFCWPSRVTFFGMTFFDAVDKLTAQILLPVGALLLSIFIGYRLRLEPIRESLGIVSAGFWFNVWVMLLRFVIPVAIIFIFLDALNLL